MSLTRPLSRATTFDDPDFQQAFETALAGGYRGASDVGEALATADRIVDGDADSWLREWTATAGTAWVAGRDAARGGQPAGAVSHYLRAETCYAAALALIARTDGSVDELDLWRRQRACWDRAVESPLVPAEHVRIPSGPATEPPMPPSRRGQSRRRSRTPSFCIAR
jgi:hypothetical protein